ncbi:hypothetical protein ACOMHN_032612 [Nucella lapillus]
MQEMPTGYPVRRRKEQGFRAEHVDGYRQMCWEWLEWTMSKKKKKKKKKGFYSGTSSTEGAESGEASPLGRWLGRRASHRIPVPRMPLPWTRL